MSRGIGQTQRAILDRLPSETGKGCTTSQLATDLGRSPRQIRTAVDALKDRGLIHVGKQVIDWKPRRNHDGDIMPVYGALVMSMRSYADWLEYEQHIRDREKWRDNSWSENLKELRIEWKMFPSGDEAREYQRDYQLAVERRLNRWIANATHCCACRACECPCHSAVHRSSTAHRDAQSNAAAPKPPPAGDPLDFPTVTPQPHVRPQHQHGHDGP